jgi:hypothetical protein
MLPVDRAVVTDNRRLDVGGVVLTHLNVGVRAVATQLPILMACWAHPATVTPAKR